MHVRLRFGDMMIMLQCTADWEESDNEGDNLSSGGEGAEILAQHQRRHMPGKVRHFSPPPPGIQRGQHRVT